MSSPLFKSCDMTHIIRLKNLKTLNHAFELYLNFHLTVAEFCFQRYNTENQKKLKFIRR